MDSKQKYSLKGINTIWEALRGNASQIHTNLYMTTLLWSEIFLKNALLVSKTAIGF